MKNRIVFLIGLDIALFFSLMVLAAGGMEIWCRTVEATDFYALSLRTQRWYARHFRFNNVGVRDDINYQPHLTPGLRRISVLGDSLTAGTGIDVSERFVQRLRVRRPDWEIHALANVGWNTGDEVLYLEDMVRQGYETDVVLLSYFTNDLDDLIPAWGSGIEDAKPSGWTKRIIDISFAANTLYYDFQARHNPIISRYSSLVRDAYGGKPWEIQKRRLHRLVQFCRGRKSPIGVVLFPFLSRRGPVPGFESVHAEVAGFLTSEGAPVLDLLPVYQRSSGQVLTVNRRDAHPNAFAHNLAADEIEGFLKDILRKNPR